MIRIPLGIIFIASALSCHNIALDQKLPIVPKNTVATMQFYGDSRENPDMYAGLLQIGFAHYPKGPVIHLGDMISSPRHPEEYKPFQVLSTQYTRPNDFYITIGNHDVDDEESLVHLTRVFTDVGDKGYYAKKIGNCYCIFLNSEDQSAGGNRLGPDQRAWLNEQLNSDASKASKYRVVMIHRPLYPQNQHKDEPLIDNDELHALFLEHKVNLVVAGHEHTYSHIVKDGLNYLITGGGGSPLFTGGGQASFFHYMQMFEMDSELKFYAIDILGRTKDEFSVDLSGN